MRWSTVAIATALLLAGCSSSSIVGRRVDNFTARYNAFYNAERAFRAGVKAVERPDDPIDRTVYLSVFPQAQGGSVPDFANAVKKSADVLRKHPSSKWVDDALLLIGTSYFYQQNYVGAEQKFREVMTLPTRLEDEARFWLARTLVASGSYDAATEHLNVSLASEELSPRWEALMRLSFAELHVKRGEWEKAAEALAQGLEQVRDNEVRARAQFLLGQVYETLGRYDEAVEAFVQVERFKPLYELSYASQLSAARVMGLHGDPNAALELLRRLERDDKHFNNRAEVIYVQGRVLQAAGNAGHALATYKDILYGGSDLTIQEIRGQTHYAIAELYRDAYEDFITAAAHFDTAATTLGQATRNVGAPGGNSNEFVFTKEAITDSEEQAEIFSSFATVMGEVAEQDSLLWLGSLDDAAFEEAVLEMRRQRARELAEEQRTLERREMEQGFLNAAVSDATRPRSTGTLATSTGGASFLFHREPARAQEGRLVFISRWGDRPLVPNWRRTAAITALAVSGNREGGAGADSLIDPRSAVQAAQIEAGLPMIDVSGVPRDAESRQAVMQERALSRYELGNVLFLSMNRPDSAAAWYRMVVEEDSEEEVALRAYYALAEVQRALGDTLAADQIYRDILRREPDSDFANIIRERLGMGHMDTVGSDSLALADAAYARAYAVWKSGRYAESIQNMMAVATRYSTTPVAPRALYAAASAYAEWAQRRDADLIDSMRVEIPDSILTALGIAPQAVAESRSAPSPDSIIAPEHVRQSIAGSLAANERALSDSLRISEEGAMVPVSASIQEEFRAASSEISLHAIYTAIAQRYPSSPYADPSQRVLKVLDQQRQERMAADSTAADSVRIQEVVEGVADSTSADEPAAVDSGNPGDDQVLPEAEAAVSEADPAEEEWEEAPLKALPGAGSDSTRTDTTRVDVPRREGEPPKRTTRPIP